MIIWIIIVMSPALILLQAYHMSNCEDVRLFCNGYYPEIVVMDPFSLEILFMLSSKQNPDWISALHVSGKLLIRSMHILWWKYLGFCITNALN